MNPTHKTARASVSDLATLGLSASIGSFGEALATFSRTSLAADSISLDKVNSILILDNSSLLSDLISLMFEIPANESSKI